MPARIPMTTPQRAAVLALPDTDAAVVAVHSLTPEDRSKIAASARTPETRLAYALQLCCLRYPGRHPRRGEMIPTVMLQYIAEQIDVAPEHVASFARRPATRYDQMIAIKRHYGFSDLSQPHRADLRRWLATQAVGVVDGPVLLDRLVAQMRERRIVIPGVSVVERMAAEAMAAADLATVTALDGLLTADQRRRLDALLSEKEHARQSRLSWLREPPARVSATALMELLDRLALVRSTGVVDLHPSPDHAPRMAQMAREGLRFTAQAFAQMGASRRAAMMVATLREIAVTLTDAVLVMFQSLVARANLRARKRLENTIAVSATEGRERLARIADVLDALTGAMERGRDVIPAVNAVATIAVIKADAALIRRTTRNGKPDAIGELGPEHATFKKVGPRLLAAFTWDGGSGSVTLRQALTILTHQGQTRPRRVPDLPLGHLERRWLQHVVGKGGINRTFWELGSYFALADALASGGIWVPGSRLHQSLEVLLAPAPKVRQATSALPHPLGRSADAWLAEAAAELDTALLKAEANLGSAIVPRGNALSLAVAARNRTVADAQSRGVPDAH